MKIIIDYTENKYQNTLKTLPIKSTMNVGPAMADETKTMNGCFNLIRNNWIEKIVVS